MTRVLAWAAAWLAPSLVLGLLVLVFSGQNPFTALAYGWTGVLGAGAYAGVQLLARRRQQAEFDEELAAHFLATPKNPDVVATGDDIAITHEGLTRMHRDIAEDEARRRDE